MCRTTNLARRCAAMTLLQKLNPSSELYSNKAIAECIKKENEELNAVSLKKITKRKY